MEFDGNGFLYKMVRLMVGTLVQIGLGKISPDEIETRLALSRPGNASPRTVAPAEGLYLVRVRY